MQNRANRANPVFLKHGDGTVVQSEGVSHELPAAVAPEPRGGYVWIAALVSLGLVIPITYILLTHHVWEDFLITFRHSKNLVDGNGLVFNPGRRVQGFTSAINTMLPALFYWVTGKHGYLAALNLYRACSLAMYLVGGVAVLKLMLKDRGIDRLAPLFFILLYVTDAKTVAFTMNGQESGFMVGFLALGFVAACRGIGKNWNLAAVSWAGLLYTRPDVPVHITALVMGALLFSDEPKRETWKGIGKAIGCAALVFLPWFVFVWIYYGQPLPHTAIAKPAFTPADLLGNPGGYIKMVLRDYPKVSGWVFEPIYSVNLGWPEGPLEIFSLICAAICTSYWIIPTQDRIGRIASAAFTVITLYLSFVNVGVHASPWYLPSATVFGLIVLARAPAEIVRRIPIRYLKRDPFIVGRLLQGAIVVSATLLLVGTVVQIRIQQREIEDNVRTQIGLYLHDAMQPGEVAYMEPLGYIGYFSDRLIYDWPGLVTPEVVALHREKGVDRFGAIPYLMPKWMVLRDFEIQRAALMPIVANNYETVKIFDARPALETYGYIPGRGYIDGDAVYYIVRRRS